MENIDRQPRGPRSNVDRSFRDRGLDYVTHESTPPEIISDLDQEHQFRRKDLKLLHRRLEAELAKSKKKRDNNLIAELAASYDRASLKQGATRKALDRVARYRQKAG